MAGSQKGFYWKRDTLFANTKQFAPRLERALVALTEYYAGEIEDAAKGGAPWTDQTSNARSGLFTVTEHVPFKRHTIILSHKVDYGIWLEVARNGKFRVIMPTLLVQGRSLMNKAQSLMGGLK